MGSLDFTRVRRFGLPALMVTAALGLSACGDDEESSTTAAEGEASTEEASAEEVTVTATEYEFDLSATPTADTKNVTFTNDGKEFHVMIFARINEGFTVDEAVELQGKKGSAEVVAEVEGPPGESSSVPVKGPIEPGEYAMLCPVGGPDGPHYKLGQLEEFSIE
jgi:plastocyanin